jgi:hypothetical protein
VLQDGAWQSQSDDLYLREWGDIRLAVEKVGADFRVLVSHIADDLVFFSGKASRAGDAMAIAKEVAERVSARGHRTLVAP